MTGHTDVPVVHVPGQMVIDIPGDGTPARPRLVLPEDARPVAEARHHTEHTMSQALWRHFTERSWAVLTQISADLKYQPESDRAALRAARVIDVLMTRPAPKRSKPGLGPIELLAIEIKVTRQDFLADLRDPAKQEAWRTLAHRHAYAVPRGLVHREEVPAASGLIEVGRGVAWTRRAPYTQAPELPSSLILTFAYRAARGEGKLKGLSVSTDDDLEDLRAELVRLRAAEERTANRLHRLADERDAWRAAFAATGAAVACGTCGKGLLPIIRRGMLAKWRHADSGDTEPCLRIRQEAAEADARARWEQLDDDERAWQLKVNPDPEQAWRVHVWVQPDPVPVEIGDAR